MAFDTLRSNKMRSALTVLGVVIGVTSIVGMTSLIRGFDTSLRDSIKSLGPNTIFVQRFGIQLLVRRVVHGADAAAESHRRRHARRSNGMATTVGMVDIWLGGGGPGSQTRSSACSTAASARGRWPIMGTSERFVEINFAKMFAGRSFTEQEVQRARQVAVIGYGAYEALFEKRGIDPIGKQVRIGGVEYTVIGVIGKRPSPGGFSRRRTTSPSSRTPRSASSSATRSVRRGPFGGMPRDDRGRAAARA